MAKSRLSGGYFGNAVDTAGESEGSGSSEPIDTEIAVLEDSSIPARKHVSLSSSRGDGDAFGVPLQVLPLSNLSPLQRKELVQRLRSELERIQLLQKKVELQRASGVAMSSSRDIVSGSNGNKHNGSQIENSKKPSMSNSMPGNKLKPLGQRPQIDNSKKPFTSSSVPVNKLKPLGQRPQLDSSKKPLTSSSVLANKLKPSGQGIQVDDSKKLLTSSSVPRNKLKPLDQGFQIENSKKPLQSSSVLGNKLKPLGQTQRPRGWNRGSSGKFESAVRTSTASTANTLLMKDCELLLKRLMNHPNAWVFNTPVDVVKLNLPDYFSIIKHPMDLGTIKSKIAARAYAGPSEFADDVRLTFSNAMTYNPPQNNVHSMADTLSKYFELRWKTIEKKLPRINALPLPAKPDSCEDVETNESMLPSKKRKLVSLTPEPEVVPPVKRVMSDKEKHNLGIELESLMEEIPVHIVDILKEHSSNGGVCEDDEIEVDIDNLGDDTLFTLRKLLDDYLQEKQKNKANAELLNDSGPTDSSLQAFKDNDPADEEVDIGGNETPFLSYPPLEIVKDTTYRMNQRLSSGSSSDMDSSSSSDNDSGDARASPANVSKVPENLDSVAQLDENARAAVTLERNQSVSSFDRLQDNSWQKQSSFDSDCHRVGDSGLTNRQVSPDKLYRAALLKNRFADTILKAREKTLTQGGNRDPDKLRRDREKLEMERRKEKARIQAEAKAAEDALKKAEAEATARKRELEREAARKALLQMEKTVNIDENSQFLEDLEMFRVPAAQSPISVDEMSRDHSRDGLGSFKLGGSNPLEKLGLYIKVDDEEEEGDPPCVPSPVNDTEEGEIE